MCGGVGEDCQQCRCDPDLQRSRGCDGSLGVACSFAADTCPGCQGRGTGCVLCGGAGRWELIGCPGHFLDAHAGRIVELAVMAAEGMGWPAPGGVLDQSADFLAAWRIVVTQRSAYQSAREQRDG